VTGDVTHALTAEGADASEDGTGRGTPIIAFGHTNGIDIQPSSSSSTPTLRAGHDTMPAVAYPLAVRGRDGGADLERGELGDPMFALRAGDGGSSRSQLIGVAYDMQNDSLNDALAPTLQSEGQRTGNRGAGVLTSNVVRRLTPLECERLQGLPDGWTDIVGASDSQRYRQCGNSVAVPVFRWVFGRLAAVDTRMREAGAA
jgi:DNA (cytosine-5)-methyltransferase 1